MRRLVPITIIFVVVIVIALLAFAEPQFNFGELGNHAANTTSSCGTICSINGNSCNPICSSPKFPQIVTGNVSTTGNGTRVVGINFGNYYVRVVNGIYSINSSELSSNIVANWVGLYPWQKGTSEWSPCNCSGEMTLAELSPVASNFNLAFVTPDATVNYSGLVSWRSPTAGTVQSINFLSHLANFTSPVFSCSSNGCRYSILLPIETSFSLQIASTSNQSCNASTLVVNSNALGSDNSVEGPGVSSVHFDISCAS